MMNGTPVWQIDGNFGLTSGVAEMLVQSQSGYTQFLPAIPDAWEKGEVRGLKARGNFTIGEKWANGIAEAFTVRMTAIKTALFSQDHIKILLLQRSTKTAKKFR